jgi:ADP-ribose pyrophosphatase YjhB (NUDIX family)
VSGRLRDVFPVYARLAWWGLVRSRARERPPQIVYHGVIVSERGVLLSVRSDLRGWELPGGNAEPGESGEAALRREILEETGLEVEIERHVGDYVRTGFGPHTARVYRCRPLGGEPRPSRETPLVRWFPIDALPDTLFPWYRAPLDDALAELPEPVTRHERWGTRAILAGMRIDVRMRLSKHRAG